MEGVKQSLIVILKFGLVKSGSIPIEHDKIVKKVNNILAVQIKIWSDSMIVSKSMLAISEKGK